MKKRMKKRVLAFMLGCMLLASELSAVTAHAASADVSVAEAVTEEAADTTEAPITEEETTEASEPATDAATEEAATEAETTEMPAAEKETTEAAEPATEAAAKETAAEADTTEAPAEETTAEAESTETPAGEEAATETQEETGEEETEETVESDAYNAASYTTTKHLLSKNANASNDDGLAIYSNIEDSSITVDYIKSLGTRYAKCTPEKKKKGEVEKVPYFKLTYENSIGSFLSGGFKDNKGNHHGASHLVEQFYRSYQVYSQVYSYSVTDDKAKTIDYYYFIYVWWEDVDTAYHQASQNDIMTYCVEYGASISSTDAAYARQESVYKGLSAAKQNKISLAIYYGPHLGSDGQYYSTKNTKASVTGYDPSTWTKAFWKRYAATQLYIWSVQSGSFSAGDAQATARMLDSKVASAGADATLCEDFLKEIIAYVGSASKLPSFIYTSKADAQKAENLGRLDSNKTGTAFTNVFSDSNKLLNAGDWTWAGKGADNDPLSVNVSDSGKLTITSTAEIAKESPMLLTFKKSVQVPGELGKIWCASGKAQDMCIPLVGAAVPVTGYLAVYTNNDNNVGNISLHKASEDNPDEPVSGAKFRVLAEHKRAAVYNPVTGSTMVGASGNPLDAENCIYGIKVWAGSKVYKYTPERYEALKTATGGQCSLLYDIAYYGGLEITTDENGNAEAKNLLKSYTNKDGNTVNCKYSIIEVSTPDPYMLPYEVNLGGDANGLITTVFQNVRFEEGSSYVWLDTTNRKRPGRLHIYKYDSETQEPLEGVVFNIYRDSACTDLYAQVVTDKDGEAVINEMPVGAYYIREVQGQSIHELYGGIDEIIIKSNEWTEVDMSNRPWIVNISIEKQLEESSVPAGQDGRKYALAGAEFGLYAGSNIAGANGKLLYEKDALIATLVTDASGKASVDAAWARKNLRLGTYYIKELKAPEGFLLSDEVYEIDATSPADTDTAAGDNTVDEYTVDTVLYRNVIVKESLRTTPIRIAKSGQVKDSEIPSPLAGAVFSAYDLDAMKADGIDIGDAAAFDFLAPDKADEYDKYRAVISSKEDAPYTVTTDASGIAETAALMDGRYAVVEVAAPYGYALAVPQEVVLPEEAGKEITLSFYDTLLLGSIRVVKLGDSLTGFEAVETKYGTWNRLAFEKKPLAGVVFEIRDEKGQAVGHITTGADGAASSGKLPCGKYTVQEVSTPAGMVIDSTVYEVEIKADGQAVADPELSVTNTVMTAELAVYKTGETILSYQEEGFGFGKKPLENVIFGIYNAEPLTDNQGNIILPAESCVGLARTNEEGEAVLKECLVPGRYYYKEVQTPEGFVPDPEKHPFILTLGTNAAVERMELNKEAPLLNKLYKARIELVKVDEDDHEIKLPGAVFGLFNAETKELYGEYTTDENGYIDIEEMPYGKWYFKELEAPKGYILEYAAYEFEVTDEDAGSVIQITATNKSTPKLGLEDHISYALPSIFAALTLLVIAAGFCLLRRRSSESLVKSDRAVYKKHDWQVETEQSSLEKYGTKRFSRKKRMRRKNE